MKEFTLSVGIFCEINHIQKNENKRKMKGKITR